MKKLLLLLLLSGVNLIAQNDTIVKKGLELQQGTALQAKLLKDLKGGSVEVGQEILFELAEPIIQGDVIYVHKGAKIVGFVTEARSSGVLGRKGKLAFTIDYLYLPNGKTVKLRSVQNKKLKGSGVAVAATAILLTPFALLIPGKGAKYKENEQFTVYLDENVNL